MALDLPVYMLSAILIGGGAGYLFDGWLHTRPFLMVGLGAVGLFAGVREALRRLAREEKDGNRGAQQ